MIVIWPSYTNPCFFFLPYQPRSPIRLLLRLYSSPVISHNREILMIDQTAAVRQPREPRGPRGPTAAGSCICCSVASGVTKTSTDRATRVSLSPGFKYPWLLRTKHKYVRPSRRFCASLSSCGCDNYWLPVIDFQTKAQLANIVLSRRVSGQCDVSKWHTKFRGEYLLKKKWPYVTHATQTTCLPPSWPLFWRASCDMSFPVSQNRVNFAQKKLTVSERAS